MPPHSADRNLFIPAAATLLAVAAGGAAIYAGSSHQRTIKQRKKRKGVYLPNFHITKRFDHNTIVSQFPVLQNELESLFKRDLPRLDGLKEVDVFRLITSLESVVSQMKYKATDSRNNIRKLVLGCCTQAVLANILDFLMLEERKYIAKNHPELGISKPGLNIPLLNVTLFGESADETKRRKAKKISSDETLLLHTLLKTVVNIEDYFIRYSLVWTVVNAENPEEIFGQWKAEYTLSFKIEPGEVVVEGTLDATRDEFK